MTPLAPLATAFLREHLPGALGRSRHTCEAYAHALRLWFVFAADRHGLRPSQLCLEHLDAALVLDFLAHIEQQRGNAAATRNARLTSVKAFMHYVELRVPAALEQIRQIHAIPTKRHDQMLVRHLTMEEVRAVLNAPDPSTRLGIRDRAMLHLCFAGGAARLRTGGAPAGASMPARDAKHPRTRQGTQRALPAALERNGGRPARLARRARPGPLPGTLRQRRGHRDDPGRLRVRARQACPRRSSVLPRAGRALGDTTSTPA